MRAYIRMNHTAKGLIALILAQTMWGLSPLYYKTVAHVPAFEVLAHRTLWTFVLFGLWIGVQGRLPWLALSLAFTFATFGAIKKTLDVGPILSVTAEVVFLAPLALIYLIGAQLYGWGGTEAQSAGAFGHSSYETAMLIFAGLVTGVPLIFFATAARLLPLTVVGMGQYWNLSLQLAVAVFVFSEPFTTAHSIAMSMIWIALELYSVQALRQERVRRVAF